MVEIPRDHPRYESLMIREKIVKGVELGITSPQGMIAHGRGETFDYLIGEKTIEPAIRSTRAALAMLLLAERPVLSVNGNVAVLVPDELVKLGKMLNAPLEVNIFHRTEERMRRIKEYLEEHGAEEVLGMKGDATIPGISSVRARVDREGIYSADVVLVPLEDGDRCKALVDMGKKVIAIDLNPLSRTSQTATVSIVDNVVRVIPNMIEMLPQMERKPKSELELFLAWFDNRKNLNDVLKYISNRITNMEWLVDKE
ncbi:MAG: 4-phosphopantoate--beta-alanine ligase [Candidatus Syntropharchaeia archaeon]